MCQHLLDEGPAEKDLIETGVDSHLDMQTAPLQFLEAVVALRALGVKVALLVFSCGPAEHDVYTLSGS
jgi:hypothetical protein